MVCLFALWTRQHDDGVAAEVLVESPRSAAAPNRLIHGHRIVFIVEARVELGEVSRGAAKLVGVLLPFWRAGFVRKLRLSSVTSLGE